MSTFASIRFISKRSSEKKSENIDKVSTILIQIVICVGLCFILCFLAKTLGFLDRVKFTGKAVPGGFGVLILSATINSGEFEILVADIFGAKYADDGFGELDCTADDKGRAAEFSSALLSVTICKFSNEEGNEGAEDESSFSIRGRHVKISFSDDESVSLSELLLGLGTSANIFRDLTPWVAEKL